MLSAFADYAHIICTPFVCCMPVEKLLGRVPCSAQITGNFQSTQSQF